MTIPLIPQSDFNEITQLIHAARQRAVQAVNTALIELYWQVRQFYEAYRNDEKVSALLRQLPWTHSFIIPGLVKVPPLVSRNHPDASSVLKDCCAA